MISKMPLTIENYIEKINSFSQADWKPLLDLIPKLEELKQTAVVKVKANKEEGVFEMPRYDYNSVISEFLDIVYKIPIIIDFEWGSWKKGREMIRNPDFDPESVDIHTKCKLITALVRSDRFIEGTLAEAFETGLMLKLLRSIKGELGY
ncbi:MAG: hypothetical protein IH594_12405 [Bacteroidales bacterium]|nr:hypothetical protein [Bacteroidales bacterium]